MKYEAFKKAAELEEKASVLREQIRTITNILDSNGGWELYSLTFKFCDYDEERNEHIEINNDDRDLRKIIEISLKEMEARLDKIRQEFEEL